MWRNFLNEKLDWENIDGEYVKFEIGRIDEVGEMIEGNGWVGGVNVSMG